MHKYFYFAVMFRTLHFCVFLNEVLPSQQQGYKIKLYKMWAIKQVQKLYTNHSIGEPHHIWVRT